MLRLIFLIVLVWIGGEVIGQGGAIPRSKDVVVIRGKSFYLHTVEAGQTLYSICKAYGVDVEEVKRLNGKKDSNLSLYEVLKIPYIEPFVEKDEKYYYHKVKKGETLYSISRYYGMKVRRLLKHNEKYVDSGPLSVGTVIRLPLDEIDRSVWEAQQKAMIPALPLSESVGVRQPIADTIEELPQDISEPLVSETEEREDSIPVYLSEVVLPADPYVKVALLLPFSAGDYPMYTDSLTDYSVRISARSEQFLAFYEGMLLAVDSLRNRGCKIDLHVYDTERSAEKMYEIAEQINRFSPDLILGPVYGSVYKVLAEQLQKKTIPMVYPLSSRSENFGEYPNFIQVNASFGTLAKTMADWLKEQTRTANIIRIEASTEVLGMEEEPGNRIFTELLQEIPEVRFFDWNSAEVPLDSLRTFLLPDRENILVLPATKEADVSKVLPVVSALTDGYQLTVLGLPEWQTFSSVDHETYFKLNTKIFTYSYVDYASDAARNLVRKYRKYFYTEPNNLAFKAFDIGLYFIGLADQFRDRTLEALEYYPKDELFSRFRFGRLQNQVGKENRGFWIVNYGSDYQLKIQAL